MSGYKISQYALELARAQKLEAVSRIGDEKARLINIQKQVENLLEETSEGLLATFGKQVEEAEKWIERADSFINARVDEQGNLEYLRNTRDRFVQVRMTGEDIHYLLIESFTVHADKLKKKYLVEYNQLKSFFTSAKGFLERWVPNDKILIENHLQELKSAVDSSRFTGLGEEFVNIREKISTLLKKADELELQHKKRLYLLKSLRQVCQELGFEETQAPHFEDEKDKRKSILYEVDTVDQGKISFQLSLEGIRTYSEIMDGRCINEFDQISQYLEEEFGVKTQFQLEDPRPDEILIAKGEKEIPDDDSVMYMEAE